MKIFSHVQACSKSTNRDHYTTQGFHMNARGKHWIANTLASIIKSLLFSSLSTSIIPLPEKNKSLENPVSQQIIAVIIIRGSVRLKVIQLYAKKLISM